MCHDPSRNGKRLAAQRPVNLQTCPAEPVGAIAAQATIVYKKFVWLNWMLDCRPTVNAMPEKVAQFVETFRPQFNIAKPGDVAIQAFGSNNFDVRIARRFRQATNTRNDAPHSRLTETLTKQVVTQ